jgi:hypothetical protein
MPEPRRRGDPAGPGPMLEAALDYCSRGWPVLPCEPRGKRPLGRFVAHGLTEATTDPAMVERWWRASCRHCILGDGCSCRSLDCWNCWRGND